MGLGDFLKGVGEAGVNLAKGVAYVANPTHIDDIAEGVGKAGKFAIEHPGEVAHIAGEVGKGILKDQLDPVNLAINAGLIAATVATGGAAAPAFIAKLGLGAKSVEAGLTAAKVGETIAEGAKVADTVVEGANAVRTGAKAVEATSSAVRAGTEAVEGVSAGAKALEAGSAGTKALEAGSEVAQTAQKGSRALELADKALGMGDKGKWMTRAQKALNPLETSEKFGMAAYRERAAQRMLQAGGEAPGLARQATAAFVQGGGKGVGSLTQLEGMSDKVYEAQKWAKRGSQAMKRMDQIGTAEDAVEIGRDPTGYAEKKAYEEADKRGIGRDAGYTDRGQTAESLYGGGSEQLAIGPGTGRQSAFTAGTQVGQPPSTSSTAAPASSSQVSDPTKPRRMEGWSKPGTVQNPAAMKGGFKGSGQHFWEGPRSQWAGGIGANYDWRPVDPLRKISAPSTTQAGRYKDAVKARGAKPATEGASDDSSSTMSTATPTTSGTTNDLNAQGAPTNFSPEVPKSGMYAISAGQAPAGSALPVTRMGEGGRSRHNLGNVQTLSQPIGAIGPGAKRTGNAVIDADSSSSDDLGFDNAGQGYFNFGNMGSGTADVGQQPNTSPMYAQGSRTSRRGTGMLGV